MWKQLYQWIKELLVLSHETRQNRGDIENCETNWRN